MKLREYLFNYDYNDPEYSTPPEYYQNLTDLDLFTEEEIAALQEYFSER